MQDFPKRFDSATAEPLIYDKWVASGGFSPSMESQAEARSILMPPPNANGALHLGHAYEIAIQDTLIRYWRMRGYKTLWQPGADHAGFETQYVFDRKLEKEGRNRFSIPRAELYQEIYDFSIANQAVIRQQFERMGASADWSRFRFMLEPDLVKTVYKTFKQLYDDGLIYRAKRPVHWCIKDQTTLSDLEVTDQEQTDKLYYLTYGPVTVATVRPETQFGDVAIAVHPEDERYKDLVGTTVDVKMAHQTVSLPVIADDYVNREFGTGALKITPAHDPNDFEIAQRHNLDLPIVIDQYGKLTDQCGQFSGMKIADARAAVVAELESLGVVEKIEAYPHTVKVCYKCNRLIEPRIIDQWWLSLTKPSQSKQKSLRDLAVGAVASGETRFITERYENQFHSWMESVRDWPLSRQIVWGIQLPVWYAKDGSVVVTEGEEPANASELTRDSDVFDTWFSSCQWPFSTLGNHNDDLETFYPTTAMTPGYELIFFWVARMMMLGIYTQGKSPYKVVMLHGIVRDGKGQKMSKSKGNTVDPLATADQYGADAIRLALLYGTAPGTDPTASEEKIRGMRNFGTKVWNIARYITMSKSADAKSEFIPVTDADHTVIKQLHSTIATVTQALDDYQLHIALESLYQFIWRDVADVYLEKTKDQLQNETTKLTTEGNLVYVLDTILRLLHPFAPFVTEALWSEVMPGQPLLLVSQWPEVTNG
ncbi:MAG TPA: valine--tRNA ligase [Patescibacteria group bacterium]